MKEVFYTFVVGVFLATSSVPVMAVLKYSDERKDVASGSSSALQQVLVLSTLDRAPINLGAQGEAVDKKSYFKRMIEIIRNPHASIQGFIQGLKSFFFPCPQIESTTSSLQEGNSCGATEILGLKEINLCDINSTTSSLQETKSCDATEILGLKEVNLDDINNWVDFAKASGKKIRFGQPAQSFNDPLQLSDLYSRYSFLPSPEALLAFIESSEEHSSSVRLSSA
ncbi:MAG: hypothetical protein ACRC12_01195, partial [Holosporales bacterium]